MKKASNWKINKFLILFIWVLTQSLPDGYEVRGQVMYSQVSRAGYHSLWSLVSGPTSLWALGGGGGLASLCSKAPSWGYTTVQGDTPVSGPRSLPGVVPLDRIGVAFFSPDRIGVPPVKKQSDSAPHRRYASLLPPAFRRNREGNVFTRVCLFTPRGVPHPADRGSTPIWPMGEYPIQPTGGSPIWLTGGIPIWPMGGTPIQLTGGTPIWLTRVPLSGQLGYPHIRTGWGYPQSGQDGGYPPPNQDWI